MVSFRTFIRSIKDIDNDEELFNKVKQFDPSIKTKKSGIRALEEITCKHIPKYGQKNTIELLKILNTLVPAVSNKSTTQNVYVKIRKAIKAHWGEDHPVSQKAYSTMMYDRAEWRKDRAEYQAKVIARNAQKKHFDQGKIFDIMDTLPDKVNADFIDLTICLQLASGGRVSEILSYSKFKPSTTPNHIIQTGILKSKTRTEVEKPVIRYSVDKFLELMKRMRDKIEPQLRDIRNNKMSHYEFSQAVNSRINRRITKYFGEREASHSLRKIYGNLAYKQYANKDDVSESSYLSDILGHDLKSLDVSKSYSTVSVIDNGDIQEEDKIKIEVDPVDMEVPKNIKKRDGLSGQRLRETHRILVLKGMPVSNKILRSYGYGSNVVSQFLKNIN
jgi:integrase